MKEERTDGSSSPNLFPSLEIADIDGISCMDNVCRLCMASKESHTELKLFDIFEENPHSSTPISELLLECLNIDVSDPSTAGMLNKLCIQCLEKLSSFTIFKKHSLHVDAKLRQLVCRRLKLAKAQALYGPVLFDTNASSEYSVNSSIVPLYFESADDVESDICISTLPKPTHAVEDQVKNPHSQDIGEIQAILDEQTSITPDVLSTDQRTEGNPVPSLDDENLIHVGDSVMKVTIKNESTGSKNEEKLDSTLDPLNIIGIAHDDNSFQMEELQNPHLFNNSTPSYVSSSLTTTDLQNSEECTQNRLEEEEEFPLVEERATRPSSVLSSEERRVDLSSEGSRNKRNSVLVPEVVVIEDGDEKYLAFKCECCSRTFPSRLLFRKHVATHLKQKGDVCKFCDKWFQTRNALTRHERIHSGEKPFKCVLCDRSFSQKEILQRHVATHTDTKPFQCSQCEKSYTQKVGLDFHIKHNHSNYGTWVIPQYSCRLCDKAFCHPSGLTRHMMVHSGRQFVCKFCERAFTDQSALRRHTLKQHNAS